MSEQDAVLERVRAAAMGSEAIAMPPCGWCEAECVIMCGGGHRACADHLDELAAVDPDCAARARRFARQ